MHYEGDAFISYAHLDNQELVEGRKGWVANLHRALEIRVGQLLGKSPHIWRDPKLAGNDFFAETLVDRLKRVAVLVAVVSPRYIRSEWTRREVEEFWKAAEQQGGVSVANKARIFKVLKTPVPVGSQLPELQGLLGYEFFRIDAETGKVRELDEVFGAEAQREFWIKLDDLAHEICALLEQIEIDSGPAPAPGPERPIVYVAETTSDLREQRDTLRRDLMQQGFTVLPASPLPYVAADFRAAVRADLSKAKLSLHLLGRTFSIIPEGDSQSLVEIQNELAIERASEGGFTRLLWIPQGLEVSDERQKHVLEAIRMDPRMEKGSDLLETPLEDFRTLVQERLQGPRASAPSPQHPAPSTQHSALSTQHSAPSTQHTAPSTQHSAPSTQHSAPSTQHSAPSTQHSAPSTQHSAPSTQHSAPSTAIPSVYLVYEQRDADAIGPWSDLLFEHQVEVLHPIFDGDETEIREYHEENLRSCHGVLMVAGVAGEAWLRRKMREIQKSAGFGRTAPPPAMGILFLEPRTAEKDRFRTHEGLVIRAWDAGADPLAPFVSRLRADGSGEGPPG